MCQTLAMNTTRVARQSYRLEAAAGPENLDSNKSAPAARRGVEALEIGPDDARVGQAWHPPARAKCLHFYLA